jgi:hypothetical protein
MKHKHAENIIAYGQDAMETEYPMERWEFKHVELSEWRDCTSTPAWRYDYEYRRKPRTININGHEVPEPVREPLSEGDAYYFVSLYTSDGASESHWHETAGVSRLRLDKGIIHLTREAAEIHANALLSFTQKP